MLLISAKLAGVQPVLEMGLSGLEVKHCDTDAVTAVTGTLGSIQALILSKGKLYKALKVSFI